MAKILQTLVKHIVTLIGIVCRPILNWLFSKIYDEGKQIVPPIKNQLCLQSATSLAKKIRNKETKAVEVMEAFINRVKEVNPIINAVVDERFELAIQEAIAVDKILESDNLDDKWSEKNAPLLGVPMSVKEAFALKGMSNTSGLVSRRGLKAEGDAIVVQRLKQAGAIPYIMTNVSELCMWYESANRLYGRTKNPYNTARIVGGSSGGEGCIISAGGAVIGIGSDIGGSIRMPAFFNGIFGHKPSRGIVPNDGQYPIPTGKDMELLCTGPMCRYAEDLLPLLKIFAGTNVSKLDIDRKVDLKSLKFYTMEDDGGSMLPSSVDPELKKAQRQVITHLEEQLGIKVETVNIGKMKFSLEMWSAKMSTAGGTSFCEYMADRKGSVNAVAEYFKWLVGMSNHTLPAIGLGIVENLTSLTERSNNIFLNMLERLSEDMGNLLGDNGVLLYPTHPKIAPYHNEPILYPFNFAYTGIFNALGLPVTQCPLGLSSSGLPLGMQLVTNMNNDIFTITLARELEKKFGGWVPPNC
ncbi:hypothetical protein KUTeg_007922 [Tegillarca granosa]|uniref:Amidase domain-containing protein n=1 Tax=Tegillarca granosa TaxID=220873 RepID=A0ABQ9FEM3_TEGGR|nr:hypothetical protein KUTeg_007922 [Tegillarca granosa]